MQIKSKINRFRRKLRVRETYCCQIQAEKFEKCTIWYCKNGPLQTRVDRKLSKQGHFLSAALCKTLEEPCPQQSHSVNLGLKQVRANPASRSEKMRSLDEKAVINNQNWHGCWLTFVGGQKSDSRKKFNKAGSRKGGAHLALRATPSSRSLVKHQTKF
jgi:hypothetical protein